MEPPKEGAKKVYINGPGHIYGKNLQKFSYRTDSLMIMKLGMEHYVLKLYKVYINDDPELTLTYFKMVANSGKLVFVHKVGPDIR